MGSGGYGCPIIISKDDTDLDKKKHRLIGRILVDLGYVQPFQIKEILGCMGIPTEFSSPDDDSLKIVQDCLG